VAFFVIRKAKKRFGFFRLRVLSRAMEELIAHLRTIVSFRSVGADVHAKTECLNWIQSEFFRSVPFRIERGTEAGAPYLFIEHPSPELLWFGHIDVVPGRDDQFGVRVEGDRALGRGVKDMKGAVLSFLLAYRDACASGRVPRVSVLLTSDEETGGKSPLSLVRRGALGKSIPVAFTPDTGDQPWLITELKGGAWSTLIAEGTSGHGALPWLSDNPIQKLAGAITALRDAFPTGTESDWRITVTPTQLQGSDAFNRIPGTARCTLDIRYPPELCADHLEAVAIVQKALPPGCRLEPLVSAEPLHTDPDHPMVRRIRRLAEEVTGAPVAIGREHGSSDARSFGSNGIPAFLYGPTGGDLHGGAEWVSLPSLRDHVEINRRLLAELSGA
jgi:succinyl-diaminopimelate desuccinylase